MVPVSIEDLIHEAKAIGIKIPPLYIEKFKNFGQPAQSNVKTPVAKTSSKGRKIKQQSLLNAPPVPPPSHAKKVIGYTLYKQKNKQNKSGH